MPRGRKIHPADEAVFDRIDPEGHGFQLGCLPACFAGPLRTAPVVLLYLSPGFRPPDLAKADTDAERDYYFRRWQGNEPLPDDHQWAKSRIRSFGQWNDHLRKSVAILNIGAYHSKTFNDYSVLAALPSSRVSLDWAQRHLFPAAEGGKRIVICLRAAAYWGLERGRKYPGTLFAPPVNRSGYLMQNDDTVHLIETVKARLAS
jgi:hypothetical protein